MEHVDTSSYPIQRFIPLKIARCFYLYVKKKDKKIKKMLDVSIYGGPILMTCLPFLFFVNMQFFIVDADNAVGERSGGCCCKCHGQRAGWSFPWPWPWNAKTLRARLCHWKHIIQWANRQGVTGWILVIILF